VRVDALSAFFAAPVFLLGAVAGVAAYVRSAYLRIFFGVMTGALALMMAAGNTILFLVMWEVVAAAAFFLVASEHDHPDVRRAAWIYLAASHIATLALFAVVVMLHNATGTWSFTAIHGAAPFAILWLALVAFGIKAGLMPFHVWLPGAHAAAPSHVSAFMSGVVIKMGIYGLVRVLSLYDAIPPSFAAVVLVAGIVSSIFGVAFALAQHDLKRLLAYHSIENIGIIVTGIGVGLVAQAHHHPALAMLGYAGALLHVWNHGLFKALLFLSGGAAAHAVHTRDMEKMGGLARVMPWTASAFLIGAAAISGLPPLNGFVSEWLLYVAGFITTTSRAASGVDLLIVLVVPALALTGALALACFVKAFGVVFLGAPRTHEAANARETTLASRFAMLPLVIACVAIGFLPALLTPVLTRVVHIAAPRATGDLAPMLRPIQTAALIFAAVAAVAIATLIAATRRAPRTVTWDCGYLDPTPRMQYTASSFARGLVAMFAWAMPPETHAPHSLPLFPKEAAFESHVPDTILDRALLPTIRAGQRFFAFARFIQSGRVQLYLLYVGVTLLILLAWSAA
ncbi:MAG TPA: proton-conducting transporter membrane subunit, partial [Thermoanaerobaculia bacterium]|nr:proton-conducting transporter membrane subunit [Thermoanaerobaculia bacterium]